MRIVLSCALLAIGACADLEASDGEDNRSPDRGGEADMQRPGSRSSSASQVADGARLSAGLAEPLAHRAYLKATDDRFVDGLGAPLAFDGDTLVAGAPFTDVTNDDDGAAWVFVRQGDVWSQEARLNLSPSESGEGHEFGHTLAIQGDVIAVGAPPRSNGFAYIFERSGTVWTRTAIFQPLFQQSDFVGDFGRAMALDGDRLVVGAPGDNSASTGVGGDPTNQDAPGSGAVYVYTRDGAGWTLEAYIKPSNTTAGHGFGHSLTLSGDTLAVSSGDDSSATGVNGDQTDTGSPGSGAVFVFQHGTDGWAQQAYIKASNTGAGDGFGSPVIGDGLAGDTLVVGASGEDSAATGVGGDQASDGAPDSGAVYVFTRTGTTWSQEAYLKASNTGDGDFFGGRATLSGNRLAVAAPGEDSAATGVDGDQTSDAAANSGAVYLFERCGAGWTQIHYIKASDTGARDSFGFGLASEGDDLAVGAPNQEFCPNPDPDGDCLNRGAVYMLR